MKTISISAKCSDLFSAVLEDSHKGIVGEYNGYVPDFLGSYGDYVELEIDVETGHILNWNPSAEDLKIFS